MNSLSESVQRELRRVCDKFGDDPRFDGIQIDSVESRSISGDKMLHIAAYFGNTEDIQALLGGGADINSFGSDYMTPLHYAVSMRNRAAVLMLLENGADPFKKNAFGKTSLDLADYVNDSEIENLIRNLQNSK